MKVNTQWLNGISVHERIHLSESVKDKITPSKRIFQSFRDIPGLEKPELWNDFLAYFGLSEAEFEKLSGTFSSSDEEVPNNDVTAWAYDLENLYQGYDDIDDWFSENYHDTDLACFLDPFEPLIRHYRARLNQGLMELDIAHTAFTLPELDKWLSRYLAFTVFNMVNRTMVLELNVARMSDMLPGDTPAERFRAFSALLRTQNKVLSLIEEYPLLFRGVMAFLDQWCSHCLELVSRIAADWDELIACFGINKDFCKISKIQNDKGDRHAGGRSVAIIIFSSGQKIVYKPRSLQSDEHFQDILSWAGKRLQYDFKTIRVLDKGVYGYQEFAEYEHCENTEQIDRFYHRMGYLLAILYGLNATDFHYENIISQGEYPMLIDLESLFNAFFIRRHNSADEQIFNTLDNSVMKIALLPAQLQLGGNKLLDLSGMTDVDNKERLELSFHAEATDEMKVVKKEVKIEGAKNYPKLNWGEKPRLLDYADTILQGFEEAYRMICREKEALLADGGPVNAFKDDSIRILLRSTGEYTQLSSNGFHPDMLRNAAERDSLYAGLWGIVEKRPEMKRVVPYELAALNRHDVPLFTSKPGTTTLISDYDTEIRDFFETSGLELVHKKIRGLNEEDLERQLWLIKASLASSAKPEEGVGIPACMPEKENIRPATKERLAEASRQVAANLHKQVFTSEGSANWIGLNLRMNHYELNPLYLDLYSGLPGVALYLLYHGYCTQDESSLELAESALDTIRYKVANYLKSTGALTASAGGFDGLTSCLYTLSHAAAVLGRSDYLETAEKIIEWLDRKDLSKLNADLLSGYSGIMLCLKVYYDLSQHPLAHKLIMQCGAYLEEKAQTQPGGGIGWLAHSDYPLTGLAHGNSGVALALMVCHELTGDSKWQGLAKEAIRYEKTQRVEEAGNWKDLRKHILQAAPAGYTNMIAWCNGAPGIGLARAALMAQTSDEDFKNELQEELNIAIRSTLKHGFGKNHSLCHGDLGNLELIQHAGELLQDDRLKQILARISGGILDSIHLNGCLCGTPLNVLSPGLMTGYSGIGYELLKFAYPDIVPSVLTLQGPKGLMKAEETKERKRVATA